jgi:predicted deacylase
VTAASDGIPGARAYPSPRRREAHLDELAARLGGEVLTYGHSVEGRALRAARIPRAGPGRCAEPRRVLLCAAIHGVEWIGTFVALGFLRGLRRAGGALADLHRRAEIWVIPALNPDAYARTWRQRGRGTLGELRTNARGVDLNRNFPRPGPLPRYALALGGWGTGADDPDSPFYRGEAPLSEPETAALDDLFARIDFTASANLHSRMGVLFPAHVDDRRSFRTYRRLGAAFRAGQLGARYPTLSSRTFDWFTGEMEDHQHHRHGIWATCVELYPALRQRRETGGDADIFWRYNPRDPVRYVRDDVPGLAAYLLEALRVGAPPPSRPSSRAKSLFIEGAIDDIM